MAKEVERLLPQYPLLYFGDTARTPYGDKSPETIISYSVKNTEFLLEKGATIIVIACNSASSVAASTLRETFQVPIIEVIAPAVTKAITETKKGKIGIIGTRATIKSDIYNSTITRLHKSIKVYSKACPLLVPLVEEGWISKRETKMIIRRYLHSLKNHQIDTLILGCTHYPLLKRLIQARIGTRVTIIDSSVEAAASLQKHLRANPDIVKNCMEGDVKHAYYVSDLTNTTTRIAEKIFGRSMEIVQS